MDRGGYRNATKVVVGVILVVCFAWMLDRWSLDVGVDTYLFSYGFWTQAFVVAVTAIALIALTARVWLACWIATSLCGVLYVANALKLRYLAAPLTLDDYFLVKAVDVRGLLLFAHYVNAIWLLFGVAAFAATCALLLWKEAPLIRARRITRAIAFVLFVGTLVMGIWSNPGARVFEADRLQVLPVNPIVSQLRAGLISQLICSAHVMAGAFDEPVDKAAVRQLLANVRPAHRPPVGSGEQSAMPDVVLIQSESFFDPQLIQQVGDTTDLLPNLHRAMSRGEGGSMIVPTFGGGTIRTEFEVLTGVPLAAYERVRFPYLELGEDAVPSIARSFASSGYQAIAVHGNLGSFWSRNHAMRVLGFEHFLTDGDFPRDAERDGNFYSDHSMTDLIISQLEKPGKPHFIFAISIEAHGPYSHVPVVDEVTRERIAQSVPFSGDSQDEFSRYAYHIAHADHEFGRLWDYLKKRGRPYVLVFYGDHLPGFRYVYQDAAFRNGLPAQDQHVPWVAVGSGVAPLPNQSIYAWMLPGLLLDMAALKPDSYLSLATRTGRDLLGGGEGKDAWRTGLYSAARLDFQGKFDLSEKAVDVDGL